MKIRAITVGVAPEVPLHSQQVRAVGAFAQQMKAHCEDIGIPVQTVRLATPPFPSYLTNKAPEEIIRFAIDLEQSCREHGIDYCSLGPVTPQLSAEEQFLEILSPLLAQTETVFLSARLGVQRQPVRREAVQAVARIIREIACATSDGFGNLRFAAVVTCPPFTPGLPLDNR